VLVGVLVRRERRTGLGGRARAQTGWLKIDRPRPLGRNLCSTVFASMRRPPRQTARGHDPQGPLVRPVRGGLRRSEQAGRSLGNGNATEVRGGLRRSERAGRSLGNGNATEVRGGLRRSGQAGRSRGDGTQRRFAGGCAGLDRRGARVGRALAWRWNANATEDRARAILGSAHALSWPRSDSTAPCSSSSSCASDSIRLQALITVE
jgi:hypothetical protein